MKTFGFELFSCGSSVYYDEDIQAETFKQALQKSLDNYEDFMRDEEYKESSYYEEEMNSGTYDFINDILSKIIEVGLNEEELKKSNITILNLGLDDSTTFYDIIVKE